MRWAELGSDGLRFGGAGSLQAPDDLLAELAGLGGGKVSRRDALRASAVLRARNLIAGVPATLPIELRDRKRELDERNWLGQQPNPLIETTVHLAQTFEDLLFDGVSYWRVTEVAADGYPIEAEHLDHRSVSPALVLGRPSRVVSEDLPFTPDDPVFVDGVPERLSSAPGRTMPGDIIRFISPNPPLLVHAARYIRIVLLLDRIAADYANDPLPFGYFKDATDDEPLDDDQINEVLNKWESARRQRRWGYVESGLELTKLEWPTPQQLQLVEARQHAVLDIARATGLDPTEVGAPPAGSSLTYQNAEQRRSDLIDFTLMLYIRAVEDRLSMADITPRGLFATFVIGAFARADTKTRMEGYKTGIDAGIVEPNEARRREGWPDIAKRRPAAPIPPSNGNGQIPSGGNGREPIGNGANGNG